MKFTPESVCLLSTTLAQKQFFIYITIKNPIMCLKVMAKYRKALARACTKIR